MTKQVLFLVHGMGNSAPGGGASRNAWAEDVEVAIKAAAASYPSIPLGDLIFHPILYDDVFERHAENWAALAEQLGGTGLEALVGWMKNAADGSFLWGSLGDVIQYRAFANTRTNVVTHVAKQISKAVEQYGTGDRARYHVLAHSLGTAVVHDALHKLATRDIDGNSVFQSQGFRIDTLMALANVSRLVWANNAAFYDETRVRPPGSGLEPGDCAVKCYITVRHVADPLPSVVRFQRKSWSPNNFFSVEVRHVRELNVHAFTHYLQSPLVTDSLLYRLFGGSAVPPVTLAKRVSAYKDYEQPRGAALSVAVQTVEAALNKLSAQAEGTFEYDLDEIGKALWDLRDVVADALKGS